MRIHIYYGGRGLIEDSTLYVLSRIFKIELLIKRTFTRNQFGILANDLKESKSGSHSVVSNSL